MSESPICYIIAGPNRAGKTTFALIFLPEVGCDHFVNADLIASGLSPFVPERERISAARLFLKEVYAHIKKHETIADSKPENINELAELTGRQPSNLSRALKTFEQYGFVKMVKKNRSKMPVAQATEFDVSIPA